MQMDRSGIPSSNTGNPQPGLAAPTQTGQKANKLEPSLEHSAKAVCQGEIPKEYGPEPRMWGERENRSIWSWLNFLLQLLRSVLRTVLSSYRSFCETGIRTRRGLPLEKPRRMEQKYLWGCLTLNASHSLLSCWNDHTNHRFHMNKHVSVLCT